MLAVAALAMVLGSRTAVAQPKTLDKDTPADVQKGSSNAVVELDKTIARLTASRTGLVQSKAAPTTVAEVDAQLLALREARAAFSRIAQDRALATRMLDAARKNDLRSIIALVKVDAPQSEVTIDSLRDWTATLSFKVRGRQITVCGSSEGGCGGNSASVSVK
jgi:hypothetical protein